MYIKNEDLMLLFRLYGCLELDIKVREKDICDLRNLIDRLAIKQLENRVKTREAIAERRKIDKNYGRSKKNS